MPVVKMPDGQLVEMPDNPTPEQQAALRSILAKGASAPAVTAPAIPELPPPPVAATTPETETAPKNIEVPSISLDLRKHPLNAPQVPDPLPLNEEQLKDLPPEVREQILLSRGCTRWAAKYCLLWAGSLTGWPA